MIPARRWPRFARWFARRAAARLRSDFDRVMIAGLDEAKAAADGAPTLWVANHVSWWDPMVTLALADRLGLETFALMAEENLERLAFFGLAGAFGVRRGDRRDGAEAIRHAVTLLDRPGRAVWVFPQGRTTPERMPLQFEPGAAAIAARATGTVVIPVGLRYRFGDAAKPELWIALGQPLGGVTAGSEGTALLTGAVQRCLDRVDETPDAFDPLWPPTSARLDLATRGLAAFASLVARRFGGALEAGVHARARAIGPAPPTADGGPLTAGDRARVSD